VHHKNTIQIELGANPGLHGEKTAINRMSYGKVRVVIPAYGGFKTSRRESIDGVMYATELVRP
jgi:hypothetical protein